MGEWQPIETAPKDGRLVLLATSGASSLHGMFCAFWSDDDEEWMFHVEGYVRNATHWMPLPDAPVSA